MIISIPKPAAIFSIALLASVLSLSIVFIAQYGFGLKPCELCLMQRVPYGIVIVIALIGLWWRRYDKLLILCIGGAFLIGCGIASYHAAVEKHWIEGPTACTDSVAPAGQSLNDFLSKIEHAPIVACDQPAWVFHGITMASMNAAWSLFLAIIIFVALQQYYKKGSYA